MKRHDMGRNDIVILGAGVTGLACGYSTGFTVFEKNSYAGGICSSYYLSDKKKDRSNHRRNDEEDYRFEYGGGHWIFGADKNVISLIDSFDTFKRYDRKASVYLPDLDLIVPFPIQNNLRYLPAEMREVIISEITNRPAASTPKTLNDWCELNFGKTLSDLFFHPFHKIYTADLCSTIQPQDGYKSPINFEQIRAGADVGSSPSGYNVSFMYPEHGLDAIISKLSERCKTHYDKEVVTINIVDRTVQFKDGTKQQYNKLITTLPLNVMQQLTGLQTKSIPDPYTSVLVVNIGGRKGKRGTEDHWIYFPKTASGFHRIGYYSNVDKHFLPLSKRDDDYVSMYIERTFRGGESLPKDEFDRIVKRMVGEVQEMGFIGEVEVCDPTWIDVAYTWSYPNTSWREEMLTLLEKHDIIPVGRYARWNFQGILDSIRDGLEIGSSFNKAQG